MTQTNWIELANEKHDEIFDAMVDAMTRQHEHTIGSGYYYDVILHDDGDIQVDMCHQDQWSTFVHLKRAIYVVRFPTFSQFVDPDSWTKSDIIESVNNIIDDVFLDIERYHGGVNHD